MILRLAQYREKSSYTQAELAKVAGVSPKTEWNWEQGKSFPNASQLWDMAVALNCTPHDLLGWYDTHPRDEAPPALAPDESELLDTYRLCTPEWKRNVQMTALSAKGESLKSAECASSVQGSMRGLEVEEMTA